MKDADDLKLEIREGGVMKDTDALRLEIRERIAAIDGHGPLVKYDADKPDLSILPGVPLAEIARVLSFGEKKYSRHNWRSPDFDFDRYMAATMRHLLAHNEGEDLDPETGLPHLAHAGCCIMFMIHHFAQGTGTTKRFQP